MTPLAIKNDWSLNQGKWLTWKIAEVQLVHSTLVSSSKPCILSVNGLVMSHSKFYPKSVSYLLSCQAVDLVKSEPKFLSYEISKTMFVLFPGAIEIHVAIHSLLKHCPSSTSCALVAKYIEGA